MAKNLVIVESPAKAKTINKLLGKDYLVKASMGHVRDLPERALGVDVEHGFAPQYVAIKGRTKILSDLQAAAAKAEIVYLAPDPDREGEAIAWHLREALKGKSPLEKFRRVTYNEITAPAIRKAFSQPGEINQLRVDSQQARRILDRVVGYKVSPMLWRRIPGASSAGRVQSVALRLVCERETAIRGFQPEPYWILGVKAAKQVDPRAPFTAYLAKLNGAKAEVKDEALALRLVEELKRRSLRVSDVLRKEIRKNAPPPFITSSLQQAASSALGFSPSRTMRIAQKLYEGVDLGHGSASGLITYMRTDSFTIAQEARGQAREFIQKEHGPEFLPETPNVFRNRSSAQEAHEAIRPTDPARTPDSLKAILERDDWRLYDLIWRRFMASQMAPARIAQRTAEIEAAGGADAGADAFLFRATASEIVFPGFMRVSGQEQRKKEEAEAAEESDEVESLPPLEKGEGLDAVEWLNDRKETQPPPRFTEASLVKVLEENGVGRPSTYAQIISTLLDRKYVDREKRALVPTDLGLKVFEFLVANLDALFDVQFTAGMEEKLDQVEEGKVAWTDMLSAFYEKFQVWLGAARGPDADATAVEKTLEALSAVKEWQPPMKRGAKTVYSDEKFVDSIRRQFAEKKRPITGRQQDALVKLIFRYQPQIPGADALIADLKLAAPAGEAEREPPRQETFAKLALLEAVEFAPPRKFGKKVYDDGEFCASLRNQVNGGKRLSPAQVSYLDKILRKYAKQIPDFEKHVEALGMEAEPPAPAEGHLEEILALFDAVKVWRPATTRKGRTWDDADFLKSLKTQFAERKQLSFKQVGALKRMAVTYAAQLPNYAEAMAKYGLPEPRAAKKGEESSAAKE